MDARRPANSRRMAAERANTRLDLPHLAEEVEDLGKSERDAVRSEVAPHNEAEA
jgi:hypothetical protein